jgi:hypothetical protein
MPFQPGQKKCPIHGKTIPPQGTCRKYVIAMI